MEPLKGRATRREFSTGDCESRRKRRLFMRFFSLRIRILSMRLNFNGNFLSRLLPPGVGKSSVSEGLKLDLSGFDVLNFNLGGVNSSDAIAKVTSIDLRGSVEVMGSVGLRGSVDVMGSVGLRGSVDLLGSVDLRSSNDSGGCGDGLNMNLRGGGDGPEMDSGGGNGIAGDGGDSHRGSDGSGNRGGDRSGNGNIHINGDLLHRDLRDDLKVVR
ncbi:hypothetical protein J437_LFUL014788 [Ladona fulva]|uniref:Uncharacterized protein n=1 Tax=Ladona fulva TaxID=123851 RepID=A0A8K0P8T1_LADFU|nr:hypothetical protein J437_LFUL014788 [Ladona fulva]